MRLDRVLADDWTKSLWGQIETEKKKNKKSCFSLNIENKREAFAPPVGSFGAKNFTSWLQFIVGTVKTGQKYKFRIYYLAKLISDLYLTVCIFALVYILVFKYFDSDCS